AAERYREQQAEQARSEAGAMLERARDEIRQERDAALEQVRAEFAGLAVTAAERIIHRSLDADAHRDLIDEVLAERESAGGGG
ncbi:MAG: F0F1 ATP synthase subunit B, partial [Chloroflexi bacterium]|nr:F0F1 ATP synthase subunit B [Chloroflexota bacterium]